MIFKDNHSPTTRFIRECSEEMNHTISPDFALTGSGHTGNAASQYLTNSNKISFRAA
jgi:hypothetical protein